MSGERAGIVVGIEMPRLSPSGRDWHPVLELCSLSGTPLADPDGVYDYTCQRGMHEQGKDLIGLDQHQVRTWTVFGHHVSVCLFPCPRAATHRTRHVRLQLSV